jgi:hypothetical protein
MSVEGFTLIQGGMRIMIGRFWCTLRIIRVLDNVHQYAIRSFNVSEIAQRFRTQNVPKMQILRDRRSAQHSWRYRMVVVSNDALNWIRKGPESRCGRIQLWAEVIRYEIVDFPALQFSDWLKIIVPRSGSSELAIHRDLDRIGISKSMKKSGMQSRWRSAEYAASCHSNCQNTSGSDVSSACPIGTVGLLSKNQPFSILYDHTVPYDIAGRAHLWNQERNGHKSRKKQQAIKNETETLTHFHQRIQ